MCVILKAMNKKQPTAPERPEPYGSLLDKLMDRDREYFAQNPDAKDYCRPYIPGEFWPMRGEIDLVRVTQVGPGVRMREPLWRPGR